VEEGSRLLERGIITALFEDVQNAPAAHLRIAPRPAFAASVPMSPFNASHPT
jgi:hypothetical protein